MLGLYGKQQYHPLCTGDCGVYLNKAAGWGVSCSSEGGCRPGRVAAPQCGSLRVMDLCCVRGYDTKVATCAQKRTLRVRAAQVTRPLLGVVPCLGFRPPWVPGSKGRLQAGSPYHPELTHTCGRQALQALASLVERGNTETRYSVPEVRLCSCTDGWALPPPPGVGARGVGRWGAGSAFTPCTAVSPGQVWAIQPVTQA